MKDTRDESYARRLKTREGVWWKRLLNVQAPYQWNLRRQRLGRTLDIGCGLGRNLATLPPGSVGIDHNEASVAEARRRGFEALTVDEWKTSPRSSEQFDSILLAHVIEHMELHEGEALLSSYLPNLRPGGVVFFICPQERGYTTDPTHVRFVDIPALEELARTVGLRPERSFSFPFPRRAGKAFVYNEFCVRAVKDAA